MNLKVVNVIASFKLISDINLMDLYYANKCISTFDESVFNYNVVIIKNKKPKMTFLIYRTGTVICTGAKSIDDGFKSFNIFKNLSKSVITNFDLSKKISIDNIVCTYDLRKELDLTKVTLKLSENEYEYEPEQFPGLIIHNADPKGSLILFSNGKIIISGVKKIEDAEIIIDIIMNQINLM